MNSIGRCEHQLAMDMETMVNEMHEMYCPDIGDEAMIDSKMSGIRLVESLVGLDKDVIRCMKLCQRIKEDMKQEVAYSVLVEVTGTCMHYTVRRGLAKVPACVSSARA